MLRYCQNCQKEYDFAPTLVSGKEELICPDCGNVIDKNSRKAVSHAVMEETEERIGKLFSKLFHFSYIYYASLSCIGIALYLCHFSNALYVVTGLMLCTFILQYFTGVLIFVKGFVLLPLGAVIGYVLLHTIDGACLGVCIVFLIRHVLRKLFFFILGKLMRY